MNLALFEGVSWFQFSLVVGAGLVIYYLYFRFYGNKGEHIMAVKPTKIPTAKASPENLNVADEAYQPQITDEMFDRGAELIEALKGFIRNTDVDSLSRQELTYQLKAMISRYPDLNVPMLRTGINDHILQEIQDKGSAVLGEREVEGLW